MSLYVVPDKTTLYILLLKVSNPKNDASIHVRGMFYIAFNKPKHTISKENAQWIGDVVMGDDYCVYCCQTYLLIYSLLVYIYMCSIGTTRLD